MEELVKNDDFTMPTLEEFKRSCAGGRFPTFVFPIAVSGEDPDNENEQLVKMVYPTLRFKTPCPARGVRRYIVRFIKERYKKQITSEQARAIFDMGLEYMYQIRVLAQNAMDVAEHDETALLGMAMEAQQKSEKLVESIKDSPII